MADKEATVYVVDVGQCMSEKNGGRTQSDLDWAMTYVWEKITSTVGEEIMHEFSNKAEAAKQPIGRLLQWAWLA